MKKNSQRIWIMYIIAFSLTFFDCEEAKYRETFYYMDC